MITPTAIIDNEAAKELNELLKLAEESTANFDKLSSTIEKAQTSLFQNIFLIYILFTLAVYGLTKPDLIGEKFILLTSAFSAILMIFSAFYIRYTLTSFRRLKSLKRDAKIEHDIQQKIISLVDDQSRRVRRDGIINTITAISLDTRLKRLDRSDLK